MKLIVDSITNINTPISLLRSILNLEIGRVRSTSKVFSSFSIAMSDEDTPIAVLTITKGTIRMPLIKKPSINNIACGIFLPIK